MVTYPADWIEDKVSDVANITTGSRDTQDNEPTGRYAFFVRSPIVEKINIYDFDCEAVLTAGDGVGTGKVFHYIDGKFAAHQRVYVMSNFKGVDGKYFYYFFSKYFIKEVEKYTAKSSVDSVRRAMIADMEFVHPSISEQKRIVDALSSFDEYIDDLADLIEKKRNIRDGALEDLITGRTRIEGYSEDFSEKALGEISNIQDGTHGTFKRTNTGVYLLSAKNVFNNKLVLEDDESKVSEEDYSLIVVNGYPQNGDILMSCVGTIGRCCVLKMDRVAFQRSVAFIRPKEILNQYLCYVIQSSKVQDQLASMVNASAQGGIYLGSLRKVILKLTLDKEEQKAIADALTAMDEEITDLEAEREKMIQIREGAKDDLLTGKVRLAAKGDS